MIKKIVKMKNVGKYQNYSFSGGTENEFGVLNLIYGENTTGKSTLTAIFKSLKTSNKNYIYGRKTFSNTGIQEVEVSIDGKLIKLSDDNFGNENIEIFDNDFVSRNVFHGDEIGKNQQGNLYEIYLDENIKNHKIEIEKSKDKKEKKENEKMEYIYSNYKLSLKIEHFKDIKENKNIVADIKSKETIIKQVKNIAEINKLLISNLLIYDFTNLKVSLLKTLDTSIEKNIENHLNDNLNDKIKGRNFITTGLELTKSENCVFCGQKLDEKASKLIGNYKNIFSKVYEELKTEVKQKGDEFLEMDFEKEILKFGNLEITFEDINLENFYALKKKIDIKIREKQLDLNIFLDLSSDKDYNEFEEVYKKIGLKIKDIGMNLKDLKSLGELEKELSILHNQKLRYEEKYLSLFKEINDFDFEINSLKNKIDTENVELLKEVKDIFKENLNDINIFLGEMYATFKLKKLKAIKNMACNTTHYCDYSFIFNDIYEVKISNKQNQKDVEKDDLPHFKNTLSDSEKRTLAFAFFLSKLKNDKNLKDKIIILDDPFSSFDQNRKEKTIQLFRDIKNNDGKIPKQKMILTHEKGFFAKCYNEFPNKGLKTFKISNTILNGSNIIEYNEEEFLTEEFFENLRYIKKSYESSQDLKEALKKARPCIEHILKRKYYFCLDKSDLSSKSISTYLSKIGDKCSCKTEIINLNLHEEMHDNHPIFGLNDSEKVSKLKSFLDLIEKI